MKSAAKGERAKRPALPRAAGEAVRSASSQEQPAQVDSVEVAASRGRPAGKKKPAPVQQQVSLPAPEVAAPVIGSDESGQLEGSPIKGSKVKRGRKAAQTATPEQAPELVATPKTARRGRKAEAPQGNPVGEVPSQAQETVSQAVEATLEPADSVTEVTAAADPQPVKAQAPRGRGGRHPRAQAASQTGEGEPGEEEPEPLQAEPETAVAAPAVKPRRQRKPVKTAAELVDTDAEAAGITEGGTPAPAGRRSARVTVNQVAANQGAVNQASSDPEPVSSLLPLAAQQTEAGGDSRTLGSEADPARQLVVEQLRKLGRPVHIRDFERSFTRQGREKLGEHKGDLEALLDALVHEGQVIRTRKRTYGLPDAMNLVRGRFQASASGFGFVIPDSGGDDYYIPEGRTMEAWNGDTVLIRPEGRGGRRGDSPAGVVVRVVVRARTQLVGSLEHSHGYAFLKPDDTRARHRIMLVPEGLEGLPDGARLVTELYWPEDTGEDEAYGQVLRVLGNEDDPETETQAVVVKYGLKGDFAPEVLEEAEAIPAAIPEEALSGRLDLRDYNIFTVDGRDAKDFDDAIHIQPTPEGNFVVGVHIADVSHYVKGGHPLDDEAYARATSVYLPGRVLPMLPEHLSNGVCSLVPDQDRLTVSALIELNIDGDILDVRLAPSVIRSKARLTYDEVQAYSEAVATLPDFARNLEGDLHLLLKITSRLRQRRLREGALDFKMREVRVDVSKDGHMELVPVREETARGMIEDLMLLANKVVAKYLIERNVPALFRIHEEPTLARFQDVSSAIGRMGLAFPGNEPTPQAYQAVLKKVRGTGQETAVNTLLLRSMQQAKYAGENLGHFGLAFDEYLHFTSPIRRYPDLLVHRVLKASLLNELSERDKAQLHAQLAEMGRHTSERERTAAEAERDLTKYYQAKWAQENLEGIFEGYVSGVIASGLFVSLENGVEGRIHISNLEDDYYHYIEDAGILKGRSSGRIFRIGEPITIRISQVNPLARQIEFVQETSMDGNETRPRARRREDRETTKREKLSTLVPSIRRNEAPEAGASTPARVSQEEQQAASGGGGGGGNGGGGRERGDLRLSRSGGQASGQNGRLARPESARPVQRSAQSSAQGGGKRRIVTLDRPRNEHLRPVNVTVQRMYFGDWTLDNMPPEESQGPGQYRSGGSFRDGRGAQAGGGQSSYRNERPAGRPQQGRSESRAPRQQAQAASAVSSAPVTAAPVGDDGSDASKRRRRRRGRRGGNGSASS
ncbi:ribonuclease R [Deinococcus sp.]|uniref:ribonuclease R n=1 Tax=Deinococcus sp. TaxID=47478 RepID=UPI003CC51102